MSGLKWIGFDLDDTLHFYKKASGAAFEAVFQYLNKKFGTDIEDLRIAYREILKEAQAGGFAKKKTSRQYRSERFEALLTRFSILPFHHLDVALDLYDATLAENLELKEGALEVLQAVQGAGLQIMVVSEGPHDAQETTLERLGIAPLVDLLITSASEQTCKTEGLLEIALQRAPCRADEILYVGDSLNSDIRPAQKAGIWCFYVGELTPELPNDVVYLTSLSELLSRIDIAKP